LGRIGCSVSAGFCIRFGLSAKSAWHFNAGWTTQTGFVNDPGEAPRGLSHANRIKKAARGIPPRTASFNL